MGLKNPQKYQQDNDQYDDYQDCDDLVQDTLTSFTFLTTREPSLSPFLVLTWTQIMLGSLHPLILPG